MTKLNRASSMQSALSLKVGGMGEFGCVKVTEIARNTVHLNDGSPLPTVPVCAKEPRACSSLRGSLVLDVLSLGDIAEIANPVIRSNPVDVVNVLARKLAVNVKPCKSVKKVCFEGNLYSAISISVNTPNRVVNREAVAGLNQPREHASLGVVMKQFTQALCGKIGLSHDAVLSLIGQRPGSVSALSGLRYFNIGVA